MIKPIELFPGALVKSKDYGIMKVLVVGYEKIMVEDKYVYEEEFFLEEVSPIPITPEIVKKLGFRRMRESSHEWQYYKRGVVEIWFCKENVDTVWHRGRLILPATKIKSVHKLQKVVAENTRLRINFDKLLK